MPNQNIQDGAFLGEELLNFFKDKYHLMFLEKLGSIQSIIGAIKERYGKPLQGQEAANALENILSKEIQSEEIDAAIKNLIQDPDEIKRFKYFFGELDNLDTRDEELDSRTRFILDAVCFDVGSILTMQLQNLIYESSEEQCQTIWEPLFRDVGKYKEKFEISKQIQSAAASASDAFIDTYVRNSLLGVMIKREVDGAISVQDGRVDAKKDGFVPMVDNGLISMKEGSLIISPNILDVLGQLPSSDEIERKIPELDIKISELLPSNLQEIENNAPKTPADQRELKEPRKHLFTASIGEGHKYTGLEGDWLKTAILGDLKKSVNEITSKKEYEKFKKEFLESKEYDVLKTSQGLFTKIPGLKTDSQKAVEQLFKEKENELSVRDRFHLFKARFNESTTNQIIPIDEQYKNLRGDRLKAVIIEDLRAAVSKIDDSEKLEEYILDYKSSEQYKVLAQGQGLATRLAKLSSKLMPQKSDVKTLNKDAEALNNLYQTDSQKEVEAIFNEKREALSPSAVAKGFVS